MINKILFDKRKVFFTSLILFILIPFSYLHAKSKRQIISEYLDGYELSSQVAEEKSIANRVGIGYRYSFLNVDDADYKKQGRDNRNFHGVTFTYGLSDNLAFELELGKYVLISKAFSKLTAHSLLASLQFRLRGNNLAPYLTGGLGLQHFNYDDMGLNDKRGKSFSQAYKTGGGLEYSLDRNWVLNTEVAYIYGNTGGEATLDVYQWRYGGGIKYYY